jgi:hypothetical protein
MRLQPDKLFRLLRKVHFLSRPHLRLIQVVSLILEPSFINLDDICVAGYIHCLFNFQPILNGLIAQLWNRQLSFSVLHLHQSLVAFLMFNYVVRVKDWGRESVLLNAESLLGQAVDRVILQQILQLARLLNICGYYLNILLQVYWLWLARCACNSQE